MDGPLHVALPIKQFQLLVSEFPAIINTLSITHDKHPVCSTVAASDGISSISINLFLHLDWLSQITQCIHSQIEKIHEEMAWQKPHPLSPQMKTYHMKTIIDVCSPFRKHGP